MRRAADADRAVGRAAGRIKRWDRYLAGPARMMREDLEDPVRLEIERSAPVGHQVVFVSTGLDGHPVEGDGASVGLADGGHGRGAEAAGCAAEQDRPLRFERHGVVCPPRGARERQSRRHCPALADRQLGLLRRRREGGVDAHADALKG